MSARYTHTNYKTIIKDDTPERRRRNWFKLYFVQVSPYLYLFSVYRTDRRFCSEFRSFLSNTGSRCYWSTYWNYYNHTVYSGLKLVPSSRKLEHGISGLWKKLNNLVYPARRMMRLRSYVLNCYSVSMDVSLVIFTKSRIYRIRNHSK